MDLKETDFSLELLKGIQLCQNLDASLMRPTSDFQSPAP